VYAADVQQCVRFYARLGFEEQFRLPGPDGTPGYVGLRRGAADLSVVTVQSPQQLLGLEPGTLPRFEMFVYVDDVDRLVAELRRDGVRVLRDPADMPWGERVAYVTDPEGNPVALANEPEPPAQASS
jgi:lactoylglutathione lyase